MEPFNFVDYFLGYTAAAESPTSFFQWSALAALAATARNNVYLETEVVTVYPNLYVLLYAKSGACKKSVPLKKIMPIVKAVKNTTLIEGRTSLQWAITKLAKGMIGHDGNAIAGASGLLFSEELSSLIVKDDQAVDYLTDLYDFHADWTSGTQARGEEKLENVCLSMLSATNDKLFKAVFTSAAVYGGLLGRTLIIMASKPRSKNSLMYKKGNEFTEKALIEHLFRVSRLKGPMSMTEEAREYFHSWYMRQDFEKHDSETGLEYRLTVHILKVSLLLSLAEDAMDKVVTLAHVQRAMELVLALVPNYRMLSANVVDSLEQKQTVMLMMEVLKLDGRWLTKAELIRLHWHEIDYKVIEDVVNKLVVGGMIETGWTDKNEQQYKATDAAIAQFTKRENN